MFKYVNYEGIMGAIINSLVLLTLPGYIMQFVSLYAIGGLSKIYRRVAIERFRIADRVHSLTARLLAQSGSFRTLTGQFEKVERGMTTSEMVRYIREVFDQQIEEGILHKDELK